MSKLTHPQDRLYDLRKVLKNINPEELDMNTYWCGTQGCLAGHYIRKHPDRGLRLQACFLHYFITTPNHNYDAGIILSEHFGLTLEEVDELFFDFSHNDPQEAKANIIQVLDLLISKLELINENQGVLSNK